MTQGDPLYPKKTRQDKARQDKTKQEIRNSVILTLFSRMHASLHAADLISVGRASK